MPFNAETGIAWPSCAGHERAQRELAPARERLGCAPADAHGAGLGLERAQWALRLVRAQAALPAGLVLARAARRLGRACGPCGAGLRPARGGRAAPRLSCLS
jgi:hypothetical protein